MIHMAIYDLATGLMPPDGVRTMTLAAYEAMKLQAGMGKILCSGDIRPDTHKVDISAEPHEPVPYAPPPDMDTLRREARSVVDWKAAKLRSWVGSHGYGQEMVYLAKELEARACVADAAPDPARYPLLAAEIGITGADLAGVAAAVVAKADEWKALAAGIEAVRLATKQTINDAQTPAAIDAAVAAANWPALPV